MGIFCYTVFMEKKRWPPKPNPIKEREFVFNKDIIPEGDIDRLNFFKNKLHDSILLDLHVPSEQLKSGVEGIYQGSKEQKSVLRADFYEKYGKTVIETLGRIGNEWKVKEPYDKYLVEFSVMVEFMRILFVQFRLVSYEELKDSPETQLPENGISQKKEMSQYLTEGRSLLNWFVLKNEKDRQYIAVFFEKILELADDFGLRYEGKTVLRGLVQEIGIYKMLQRNFKDVRSATPEEDAKYKIDFFATTRNGRNLIIQSKSTSPIMIMGHDGPQPRESFIDETEIHKVARKMESEGTLIERTLYTGGIENSPALKEMHKLEENIEIAKKYATEAGIQNPEYYFVVAKSNHFHDFAAWEKTPEKLISVENQMKIVNQN